MNGSSGSSDSEKRQSSVHFSSDTVHTKEEESPIEEIDHVAIQMSNEETKGNLPSLRGEQLVELTLENITYAPSTRSATTIAATKKSSSMKSKRTTILTNVTTKIAPYELSAWMGPSGCGKTSLISVAAGLIDTTNDLIEDSCIKINGEVGAPPKRMVGVVWQDDLLLSNLTVKETVRFAARLKNPKDVSDDEVEMLVHNTLAKLGLTHVQDSLIGIPGGRAKHRGISGGERKRVAVAVELVAR